jgi:glycosyltransferase involved in cell wall biosynthesis
MYIHEGIVAYPVEIPKAVKQLWKKSLKLAYAFSMLLLATRVIRRLKEINPDVVVLNYPSVYTGMLGFFSAKLLRKRCVLDFNDLIAQYTISLLNLKTPSLMSMAIVMVQDLIVKHSDVVIAPTNFIRTYALSLAVKPENIYVIPNGVDTQLFDGKGAPDARLKLNLNKEKVCLYFGRLDEWAGVRILREISNIFELQKPDVKFLIVGRGNSETEFPPNAVMVGEVPYHEIPKIISIADVILVPFPENEVSHAASPLKLFEAMAMGKSVIASRVSGIRDVIKDGQNGLLVSPAKPEEWVEAVQTVLNSKSMQRRLGRNAEESVKRYDWNVLASQFESILLDPIIEKNRQTS